MTKWMGQARAVHFCFKGSNRVFYHVRQIFALLSRCLAIVMHFLSSSASHGTYHELNFAAGDDVCYKARNKIAPLTRHLGRQARVAEVLTEHKLRRRYSYKCSALNPQCPDPVAHHSSVLDEESPRAEVSSVVIPVELRTLQTLNSGRAHKVLHGLIDTKLPGVEDLPPALLKRLIAENLSQKPPLNIGRKGIWGALIQDIQARWSTREVVKLRARHTRVKGDMKDTARELELASGGIVIWRSGGTMLLYRGYEMDGVA